MVRRDRLARSVRRCRLRPYRHRRWQRWPGARRPDRLRAGRFDAGPAAVLALGRSRSRLELACVSPGLGQSRCGPCSSPVLRRLPERDQEVFAR